MAESAVDVRGAVLATALDELRAGRSVLLCGDLGIGKSSLADAIALRFANEGHPTRRVIASSPHGRAALADPSGKLSPLADSWDATLLVVDDLHLLGEADAAVVHQVIASGRCQCLATARTPLTSGPIERIRRLPHVREHTLTALSDDDLVAIVRQHLDAPLAPSAERIVAAISRGNPLYAIEVVQGSLATGSLALTAGRYAFNAPPASTALLGDLVVSRLNALGASHRHAVEALTLAGALDADWFSSLVGLDVAADLERQQLVRWSAADGWLADLAHPIYREAVAPTLGEASRRARYRWLAEHTPPADPARNTLWRWHARLDVDAADLATAASALASVGEQATAARLAVAAFRTSGSSDDAMFASRLCSMLGDHREAAALLADAAASQPDTRASAMLHMRLLEEHFWAGELDRASSVLAEVGSSADEALVGAMAASNTALGGDVRAAAALAEPLTAADDPWAAYVAQATHACSLVFGDDPANGVVAAVEATRRALDLPPIGDPGQGRAFECFGLLADGRVDDALDACRRLGERTDWSQPQPCAWAAMSTGFALSAAGSAAHASAYLADAELAWTRADVGVLGAWCVAQQARAAALLGLDAELAAALARLDDYPQLPGLNAHLVALARAWGAVAAGEVTSAVGLLASAIEAADATGQVGAVAELWHDAVRLGVAATLEGRSPMPSPRGAVAATRIDLVRAYLADDTDALAHAAYRFTQYGMTQAAIEAWLLASRAHKAAGRQRAAQASAHHTFDLPDAGLRPPVLRGAADASTRLSAREREIAVLASRLSNREIADRLVISVRTVENQLQRAYAKLGIGRRTDLETALRLAES